jgi:hypothetical protein
MKLFFLTSVAAIAAFSQTPAAADLFEKAPPDVDQALRARVKEFYQHHIDGTYRKAEKMVAEESQDYFYQVQKQRYESCEFVRITYKEEFTRAVVTMACKGKWNINGNEMAVSMPLSSSWRRDNGGEWFWHHVPPQKLPTPFGDMDHQAANLGKTPEGSGGLQIPSDMKAAGELLLKQVKVDKQDILLKSYEKSEDRIVVTNGSGGSVKLTFEYEAVVPGFKAEFDKKEIGPGETATLKLSIDPKDRVAKPSLIARIFVEPLMQQFQVKIQFAIPPELEKELPKLMRPQPKK